MLETGRIASSSANKYCKYICGYVIYVLALGAWTTGSSAGPLVCVGVEGVMRSCCEKTLGVLRQNKESLLTIIEVCYSSHSDT